jgi:hypothetical protein
MSASGEILTILCDPDETDLRGVDTLALLAGEQQILSYDADEWIGALARNRRPAMILAIGRNMRAVEACQSIAACADVPFLHLSSARFPLPLVAANGEIALCQSYGDIGLLLGDLQAHERHGATEHPRDTGWNTYWRHLAQM